MTKEKGDKDGKRRIKVSRTRKDATNALIIEQYEIEVETTEMKEVDRLLKMAIESLEKRGK